MREFSMRIVIACLAIVASLSLGAAVLADEDPQGQETAVEETSSQPDVQLTVKPANKNQYFKCTGRKWYGYPVSYRGSGPSAASTVKNLRMINKLQDRVNYNILWNKNHRKTTIKITADKAYSGLMIRIKDSCRHRTWKKTRKSKVFIKTVRPERRTVTYTFDKKRLQYEDHDLTITAYVNTEEGIVKAGELCFHVHVKDKGEQIVDTACRYLGRVSYSNFRRQSVNSSTKSRSWLNKHLPARSYADCSSFVSHIYRLHGLWSGEARRNNFTRMMGPNARRQPAGMKRRVKRTYKNMGCVWLVADNESGHKYAHTAIIVGNNYYINVTAHSDTKKDLGKWSNACFQKCTAGRRNFAVKEVYNYRSW